MHKARKRFGQHFLHDQGVIHHIVDAIRPTQLHSFVEIGPGQGALTDPILKIVKRLDVIEIDRDLIAALKMRPDYNDRLIIHEHDALTFDFGSLATSQGALHVFGNLPYNISTPLIFHLLTFATVIAEMVFMLQKEVVMRMAASAGSEDYGRLSVMVQYYCRVEVLFDVPPSAFDPPPKVDSSVVRLVPYRQLPYVAVNESHFFALVKQAFSQRRKTLRNSLKGWLGEADWQAVAIDSQCRPEELDVSAFVKLSNRIQSCRPM